MNITTWPPSLPTLPMWLALCPLGAGRGRSRGRKVEDGTLLLLLFLLVERQTPVDASDFACANSCPVVHPQQRFCSSDIAFKVNVTATAFVNEHYQLVFYADSTHIRYKGVVVENMKGGSWMEAGTEMTFYSPTFKCALPMLQRGGIYLIAGQVRDGMLTISQCEGLAMKWSSLTQEQRQGFEGLYQEQCRSCEIEPAWVQKYYRGEEDQGQFESRYWSRQGCFYNPIASDRYGGEDCETLYSTCVPINHNGGAPNYGYDQMGGTTGCMWRDTPAYQECYQQRDSAWFFTDRAEQAITCRSQCSNLPSKQQRWRCVAEVRKLERRGHQRC
ncbi:uncharacterized protein [Diadema antillarum]|uniref:uncharacterized protein n=1 Tax=Diadema antillarum TaxID=105358 RepID=UPI003A88ACB8